MNFSFRSLTLTAFGLSLLALQSGCEVSDCKTEDGRDATCAESIEVYTSNDANETLEEPYEPGMDLVVENIKGSVEIIVGDEPGVVRTRFVPFTYRGHSKDAEAGEDIANLSKNMTTEGNAVRVFTERLSGWSEIGASLTVEIPPEFDGAIRVVVKGNGVYGKNSIAINESALAWSVHMETHKAGDCDLDGDPAIIETYADCKGRIEIINVSDNVTAFGDSTFAGNDPFGVRVSFARISESAEGGQIESTEGNVELNLPEDGSFVINATPNQDGEVQFATGAELPDTCEVDDHVVTCGDGAAQYVVRAGTDDKFDPGHVNISFH